VERDTLGPVAEVVISRGRILTDTLIGRAAFLPTGYEVVDGGLQDYWDNLYEYMMRSTPSALDIC
jgi:hypothetical protein